MAIADVYEFYRKMEEDNIILSFKGEFTSELLMSLLHVLESRMDFLSLERKKKKRVFNVLVECFQNLYHHIELQEEFDHSASDPQKSALIMVKNVGDKFIVRTGNHVRNEGIDELKEKLASVNAMNHDQLRELYQEKLKMGELSEKGTAGLGFIDIARKSKNKLDYDFLMIDNDSSFFCLNVLID